MLPLALTLIGAALAIGACFGAGSLLFRSLPLGAAARFGLGGTLLSSAVFLLLTAGWARDSALLALVALALLAAVWRGFETLRRRTSALGQVPAATNRQRSGPPVWAWGIVTLYGALYLIHALAPEVQPDAVTYHLGLVREWLRLNGFAGRVGFYETLPHGLEMLFVPAFAVGGNAAAKLVHLAFLAATIPVMLEIARHSGLSAAQGRVGVFLYACAPVVGVAATSAYSDAALVFYGALALLLLLRCREHADWRYAAAAGLAAGFCYAVKMTGGVAPAAGFLWLSTWPRPRLLGAFAAGAVLTTAPWLVRNLVWAGNPAAPFANAVFENPYFHVDSERNLGEVMRGLGGVSATGIPLEITIRGEAFQGMIGPVFLLAAVAVLAIRRRAGRLPVAATAVLAVPWALNPGARFLMPALPFLALAMASVLPRAALAPIAVIHAMLSLPPVAKLYAGRNAWRLHGFPWRAALGLQPEQDYLREKLWTSEIATRIGEHARPGEMVFDLFGAPWAYTDAVLVNPWQSAAADRMREALRLGGMTGSGAYFELRGRWAPREITALRFRLRESRGDGWSINEVRLTGVRNEDRRGWRVSAWPNVWEAPLALDRNQITRWAAWETPRTGMYLQIDFPARVRTSGATLTCLRDERQTEIEFLGRETDGTWRRLVDRPGLIPLPGADLRRSAVQALRREGASFILVPASGSALAEIGRDLVKNPREWGVTEIARVRGVHLFRVE